MAERIKLVQGDTRPLLNVSITDPATGLPIDLSAATVRLHFRAEGDESIKATLLGAKLPGFVRADGSIDTTGAYASAGGGGRVAFQWGPADLDTAGNHEGEIEVTFGDATVQTVFDILKFRVRAQF